MNSNHEPKIPPRQFKQDQRNNLSASLRTILIVDDNKINRTILANILTHADQYHVLEACNGEEAKKLLYEVEIAAIMLDIVMPIINGYEFLEWIQTEERFKNIPVIVTTGNNDIKNEIKVLTLGAWDFVSKPYNPEIILFRLRNAIDRSQLTAFSQLQYLAEYDRLTNIFNKATFFKRTREMIDTAMQDHFVFFRFDIDRFQLINSFFGEEEGDRLLIYIASWIKKYATKTSMVTFGRMESDVFCFCMLEEEEKILPFCEYIKEKLIAYNPNYDVVPSIGIYQIDDNSLSIETMYNHASLAAKSCKGNYISYYAYYNQEMSMKLKREQEIINDMNYALENNQFEIYLQPKYNIQNNNLCGAEALVRWNHPQKGLLSPNEFIPIFERNGFITKLDYYVWDLACQYLKHWKKQGNDPFPISVNVSRVNLYNPLLVEEMIKLVQKYELEPELLNLELTESAYTDNPIATSEMINRLQEYGFLILMDDFGSGYSSLNVLKDIAVDVIKIDMRFLAQTKIPGRGENIIASVVRMAKWLHIPVIAEGAEKAHQVEFLRSIGCDFVQGYYFARPMPVKEYIKLCDNQKKGILERKETLESYRYDDLFLLYPQIKGAFYDPKKASALYEFSLNNVELVRASDVYYELLGYPDKTINLFQLIEEEYRESLMRAFATCVNTKQNIECEYMRRHTNGKVMWVHINLCYVSLIGNKHIILGDVSDITFKKEMDIEMQRYRDILLSYHTNTNTILIVDDAPTNRVILKKILENQFSFLEAGNGQEALEILKTKKEEIDLILLDIVMQIMDGKEFLTHKKRNPDLDVIPVIMITADDSAQQQSSALLLGANDYIMKPFIPEVIVQRVKNVLGSTQRLKEIVKQYSKLSEQVKLDPMSGLLNRVSTETLIKKELEEKKGMHAMMMIDIDNFKIINDTYGHRYGDQVICAVAITLRDAFRKEDIVARMGGDEFAIFMSDLPSSNVFNEKIKALYHALSMIEIEGRSAQISCSIGIVISKAEDDTFEELYTHADKALYDAKCSGGSKYSVYGKNTF